jgi:hypothetical protein
MNEDGERWRVQPTEANRRLDDEREEGRELGEEQPPYFSLGNCESRNVGPQVRRAGRWLVGEQGGDYTLALDKSGIITRRSPDGDVRNHGLALLNWVPGSRL